MHSGALLALTAVSVPDEQARNCRIELDERAVDILPRKAHTFYIYTMVYKRLKQASMLVYPRFFCDNLPAAKNMFRVLLALALLVKTSRACAISGRPRSNSLRNLFGRSPKT